MKKLDETVGIYLMDEFTIKNICCCCIEPSRNINVQSLIEERIFEEGETMGSWTETKWNELSANKSSGIKEKTEINNNSLTKNQNKSR